MVGKGKHGAVLCGLTAAILVFVAIGSSHSEVTATLASDFGPGPWLYVSINKSAQFHQTPSIALDDNLGVHIGFYSGMSTPYLMYTFRSYEGNTTSAIIDSVPTYSGNEKICSIAADGVGHAHIVYAPSYSFHNYFLYYANNTGGAWARTNLSAELGAMGAGDIAVDDTGNVFIATVIDGNISCISNSNGTWNATDIGGYKVTGYDAYAIALGKQGSVHLCFYGTNETGEYGLWYASDQGGVWTVVPIDLATGDGWEDGGWWGRPSIAIGPGEDVNVAVNVDFNMDMWGRTGSSVDYYHGQSSAGTWPVVHWDPARLTTHGFVSGRAIDISPLGSDSSQIHVVYNNYGGNSQCISRQWPVQIYPPGVWGFPWGIGEAPQSQISSIVIDPDGCLYAVFNDDPPYYEQSEKLATVVFMTNAYNVPGGQIALSASAQGNSVTLSWSQVWTNSTGGLPIDGYHIFMSDRGEVLATVGSNTTSYTVTNLTYDTTYEFFVMASNELGMGGPSNYASATTGPEPRTPGEDRLPMAVVYGITVVAAVGLVIFAIYLYSRKNKLEKAP